MQESTSKGKPHTLFELIHGTDRPARRTQAGVLVFSCLLFLAIFLILHPGLGDGAVVFSSLPILIAGWFFGPRVGAAAALLMTAANFLVISLTGSLADALEMEQRGLVGTLGLITLGALFGWVGDLRRKMRADLELSQAAARRLEQSETRYRSLFESSADGITLANEKFIDCNEQICKMWACTRADIIGAVPGTFTPEFQPDGQRSTEAARERAQAARAGQAQVFFWQNLRRDGQLLDTEVSLKAVELAGETILLAQIRDLTERRAIEKAEQEQRALAEALGKVVSSLTSVLELEEVLENILNSVGRVVPHDAANIALVNNDQLVERIASNANHKYGGGQNPLMNLPYMELSGLAQMARSGKPVVVSDSRADPAWIVFPESAWVRSYVGAPIRVQGRTVGFLNLDSATPGFFQAIHGERLAAFADLAGVAIHNARLYEASQQQAVTDELTGLHNRRGLLAFGQHEVERSLRFGYPLTVVMLDVDNFKQVNDQYSYQTGDEVLFILSQRLRQNLRAVDVAARYGGDEFVFVLPDTTLNGALQAGERVRAAVSNQPFATSASGELCITVSVGVAALVPPLLTFEQLLDQAGAAIHAAKFTGRNRVAS